MLYALIKRAGVKSWTGVIPNKGGLSKNEFQAALKRILRKGYSFRIVNGEQAAKYLKKRYKKKE